MIIDHIDNAAQYNGINKRIEQALKYLKETDFTALEPGKYEVDGENVFAMVQQYTTKGKEGSQLEAHRKYIDVQFMVSGKEQMGYTRLNNQVSATPYSEENDFVLYDVPASFVAMETGMFAVFYPQDLHMPGIQLEVQSEVKKVVVKVRV